MTSVTEVRSASTHLFAGTWRPPVSVITTLDYFSSWSMVSRAMHASKVRASSSYPRLPLCQILFLSRPQLWSYLWRKNRVLNHSITHTANLMPQKPKFLLWKMKFLAF